MDLSYLDQHGSSFVNYTLTAHLELELISNASVLSYVPRNSSLIFCSLFSAVLPSILPNRDATYPFYFAHRRNLVPFVSDLQLSLAAPFLGFWIFCAFFRVLDLSGWSWLKKYRLHEPEEITKLNRATVSEVVTAVFTEQILQSIVGLWWLGGRSDSEDATSINHTHVMSSWAPFVFRSMQLVLGSPLATRAMDEFGVQLTWWWYWYIVPVFQMLLALFIIDSWQYFGHRLFHTNRFLYKHFHSLHHRLYVPYCFGGLYNHWVEAIVLDIAGAAIAHEISAMTVRQGMLLFTFATVKTVDDHCGYAFPWDPFHFLFANNVLYHDIHHRPWGIKFNYSQPFFIHWDSVLGTRWRGDRSRTVKSKKQRVST